MRRFAALLCSLIWAFLALPCFADIQPAGGGSGSGTLPTNYTHPMQCRLYLSPGAPAADATNATNFYIGPKDGNNISLPDSTGNVYTTMVQPEITTAVPAEKYRIEDVFEYNNAGTVTVEVDPWDATQAVSGTFSAVTAANPCVITAANSFSAGQLIGISGITGTMGSAANGLNGRVFKIASCTGTTITLEANINTTGLSWSSGGIAYALPTSRSTGLTFWNGQYLRTGALNKVYIGTFMAGADGVSGQAQDNISSRLVWNYYNRLAKLAQATYSNGGSNYTYAGFSSQISNQVMALGFTRIEILEGLSDQPVMMTSSLSIASNSGAFDVGVNTCTAGDANWSLIAVNLSGNGAKVYGAPLPDKMPNVGYSFIQSLDRAFSANVTYAVSSLGPNTMSLKGGF